jgi:hypothetical protein
LIDLLLREQFVQSCSNELSAYLKEQQCLSIDHLTEMAERYVEAHGVSHFGVGKSNGKRSIQKREGKKDDQSYQKREGKKDDQNNSGKSNR